jgi:hypothetical protein
MKRFLKNDFHSVEYDSWNSPLVKFLSNWYYARWKRTRRRNADRWDRAVEIVSLPHADSSHMILKISESIEECEREIESTSWNQSQLPGLFAEIWEGFRKEEREALIRRRINSRGYTWWESVRLFSQANPEMVRWFRVFPHYSYSSEEQATHKAVITF